LSKSIKNFKKEADSVKDIALISVANQEKISLDTLKNIFDNFQKKYQLAPEDILQIMYEEKEYLSIPLTIFSRQLSPLESVVKFLKEDLNLGISTIAKTLQRNQATIWLTYNHAQKKKKEKFIFSETKYWIPISLLKDRRLSILELVVEFLKKSYSLNFHQIAVLIQRDDRTVWTVYQRGELKRKNEHK
jgi:hypothetical protein